MTTAGDRDRTKPFGRDRRARRLRQGDRGGAARRADRRRRPLRQGHDLDGPGGAGDRRVPAARGPARRARAALRPFAPGMRDRDGIDAAARAAPCARAGARDRAAARQHRHAAAQAAGARPRRDRPRRVRPRPARARTARSAVGSTRKRCFPRPARARSRCRCRAGEEELVAVADDLETRRRVESERACVALIGGGCLAPIAAHHDGSRLTALVADEDGAWVERRSGGDPAEVGATRCGLVRAREDPARRARGPSRCATSPRGLGHEVGLRAARRAPSRSGTARSTSSGYDWVVVTSVTGAHELRRRMRGRPPRGSPRSAPRRPRRWAAPTSSRASRRRRACWRRSPGRRAASSSPARRARDALLVDELGAEFVPLYRTVELRPGSPEADLVVLRRRRPHGRSPRPARACPPSRSGRRPRAPRKPQASGPRRGREPTISTDSSRLVPRHVRHFPDRLRAAPTTSSASATG